jgi:hypothetical protein
MKEQKITRLEEIEQKRPSKMARNLFIVALLIACVAIAQHFFGFIGVEARQDFRMTDTEVSLQYNFDVQASFFSFGNRYFFFSTREGIQYISSTTGESRWQHGFSMARPVMVGRGNVVAVGEENGLNIYVFDSSGLLYHVQLPSPLLYFTVNQSGYLSAIVRTDVGYMIMVYSPAHSGNYIYRAPFNDSNVFPFSVDVSNCGTYIIKSLVDVNRLLVSRLTFSYVRRVDSRGVPDGLFAAYEFPNEFIVRSRFTNCGKVIVVTDERILGFEPGTEGQLWSIPFYNQPDRLYVGDTSLAFITGEPFLNEPKAKTPGILHIYDFDGQPLGTYDLGRRVNHLSINHNTVLVGTDRTFYAISRQGTRLWTYTAMQDVRQMLFLENTDSILQAGSTRATVLRRLRAN